MEGSVLFRLFQTQKRDLQREVCPILDGAGDIRWLGRDFTGVLPQSIQNPSVDDGDESFKLTETT